MVMDMTNWFGADRGRIEIIGDIVSPIDVEWGADVNPDRVLEESGMVTDRSSGRDRRFVAEHRGGSLLRHDHHALAVWAASCAQRVLAVLWIDDEDGRPLDAVQQARAWARGEVAAAPVMRAAVAAHAAAREAVGAKIAAARAAGHAAGTAHMADHCLVAADYALKAAEQAGMDVERERRWQERALPDGVRTLVMDARG